MKYSIDKTAKAPAYLQLYHQLRRDIAEGTVQPGSRLPSKRLMAEELGLSLITVEHAYDLLLDEGYIISRQRSGYYAAFGAKAEQGEKRPVPAAQPIPPAEAEFPFSVLAKTMRRVLSDYDRRLLIKSPECGCPELRRAVAEYLLRSRGIKITPEQIIIGSGAEYLYGLSLQLFGAGTRCALETPCYEKIRRVYEAYGAECELLRLGEDGILSDELACCHARLLHVTPYNSYPSGVTASASKRHEYARWAAENDSYIVEDDYDSEASSALKQIDTIFSLAPERVIYINTFSRTIAPSMRTGYMVLPEKLLEEYRRRLGFYSCTVPVFEQYVLAEIISNGDLERQINRRRRRLRQQRTQQQER